MKENNLIKPIKITMPFEGTDFKDAWECYKAYLIEVHQQSIVSRREKIMLERLVKLSDNNKQRAMKMLKFFIANGLKSMYRPIETELANF